jgi:DNA-binding NarL/FixJ family response regulator
MTPPVRVVLADDHPMFRFGVAAALNSSPEVEVVGEAADGRELIDVTARTRPDVVLTDLTMPGLDGPAAMEALAAGHPNVAVLVLTMHDDDDAVYAALRAGARGYLLKGAERAEIVRAILAVAAGDAVYGRAVARRIVDALSTRGRQTHPPGLPQLTPRERDVLDLLAAGYRNSDIASQLNLADKTVRNHISAVLLKLQVPDRTAAALKARAAGLGTTHPHPQRDP